MSLHITRSICVAIFYKRNKSLCRLFIPLVIFDNKNMYFPGNLQSTYRIFSTNNGDICMNHKYNKYLCEYDIFDVLFEVSLKLTRSISMKICLLFSFYFIFIVSYIV